MINYSYDKLTSKAIRIHIAQRLHFERQKAGLSLDKLAELTNYSKPTVIKWEKGWDCASGENVIPTLDQIVDLCAIYKCSPGYLLCEYDERTRQSFDARYELGLTEESVKHLQEFAYQQLDVVPLRVYGVFMAFLNHFISNYNIICEQLYERHCLEFQQLVLNDRPGSDKIVEAFKHLYIKKQELNIFSRQSVFKEYSEKEIKSELINYFTNCGFDESDVTYLSNTAMEFLNILTPTSRKQSDFLLSEAFLEIVSSFFSDYKTKNMEYTEFIISQKDLREQLCPCETRPCSWHYK